LKNFNKNKNSDGNKKSRKKTLDEGRDPTCMRLPIGADVSDLRYIKYRLDSYIPVNQHFFSAEERSHLEGTSLFKVFSHPRKIRKVEIGASSRLLSKFRYDKNLFINRAVIEDADFERKIKVNATIADTQDPNFKQANYCECCLGDDLCQHIIAFGPDVIIMTHVIYYLNPKLIYNILKRKIMIIGVAHVFDPLKECGSFNNGFSCEYTWKREKGKIKMNLTSDKCYEHDEYLNYLYNNSTFSDGCAYIRVIDRIRHKDNDHLSFVITPRLNDLTIPNLIRPKEENYPCHTCRVKKESIIINRGDGIVAGLNSLQDGECMLMNTKDKDGNPTEHYFAVRNFKGTLKFRYLKDEGERGRLLFVGDVPNSKRGFRFWNEDRWAQIRNLYTCPDEEIDFQITVSEFNRLVSEFLLGVSDSKIRSEYSYFLRNSGKNCNCATFVFLLECLINELFKVEIGLATLFESQAYKVVSSIQKGEYTIQEKTWYTFWRKGIDVTEKDKKQESKIDPDSQKMEGKKPAKEEKKTKNLFGYENQHQPPRKVGRVVAQRAGECLLNTGKKFKEVVEEKGKTILKYVNQTIKRVEEMAFIYGKDYQIALNKKQLNQKDASTEIPFKTNDASVDTSDSSIKPMCDTLFEKFKEINEKKHIVKKNPNAFNYMEINHPNQFNWLGRKEQSIPNKAEPQIKKEEKKEETKEIEISTTPEKKEIDWTMTPSDDEDEEKKDEREAKVPEADEEERKMIKEQLEKENEYRLRQYLNKVDKKEDWDAVFKQPVDSEDDYYNSYQCLRFTNKTWNKYYQTQNCNASQYQSYCFWICLLYGMDYTPDLWTMDQTFNDMMDTLEDEKQYSVVYTIYDNSMKGTTFHDAIIVMKMLNLKTQFQIKTPYGFYEKWVHEELEGDPIVIFVYPGHYSLEPDLSNPGFSQIDSLISKDAIPGGMKQSLTHGPVISLSEKKEGEFMQHYCIEEEVYNSLKFSDNFSQETKDSVWYSEELLKNGFDLTKDYQHMIKHLPCTCRDNAACYLSDVRGELAEDWIYYQQCPRNLAFSAKRVIQRLESQNDTVNDNVYYFYEQYWRPKIRAAIKNKFYVNVESWYNHLPSRAKQKEVGNYYWWYKDLGYIPNEARDSTYKAFGKVEFQKRKDKFRMIGNPSGYHKYVCGPATHGIEEVFKEAFGGMFAIGRSYQEKEKYLNEMKAKGYDKYITLDLSGFDQSHTQSLKRIWESFIDDIISIKAHEIERYISLDEFRKENCNRRRALVFEYFDPIEKRIKFLWRLNIIDKMVSGSAFTSTLNTFMMIIHCLYVAHLSRMDIVPHAAGDDVLCHTRSIYSDRQINDAFYAVFQPKDSPTRRWGNGLILKYCAITENPHEIKPCSTEVFICKKHGFKICRPFYKVCQSIFTSHKFNQYKKLNMPINLYKKIVKTGDFAWYEGLKLYNALFDLFLNPNAAKRFALKDVCKYIKPGKGKIILQLDPTLEDPYKNKPLENDIQKKIREWQGNNYYIDRKSNKNCPLCNEGFNMMIQDLYGTNSETLITLFQSMQIFGSALQTDYLVPYIKHYEEIQSKLEKAPDKITIDHCASIAACDNLMFPVIIENGKVIKSYFPYQ
jgi:hypothetical protein